VSRAIALLAVAVAAGCGESQGGAASRTNTADGAPPDATAPDVAPDVAPADRLAEGPAGGDAPGESGADAPRRCPPVAPADLQAWSPEQRIAVGGGHICGIRDDGTVTCWGYYDDYGEATPPAGTFARVSAGADHTCGIRTSGEVECWGRGKTIELHQYPGGGVECVECGQSMAPPGRFLEIAAGDAVTCGLRPDLTIECWGANMYGETEPPCGQFVQMSAAQSHACAVGVDARISCWPTPLPWRTDATADGNFFAPRDEPAKQVSLEGGCACILYATGEAECSLYHTSIYPPFTGWVERWTKQGVRAVFCGNPHACVILDDGTVDCNIWTTFTLEGTFDEMSCRGGGYCCGLRPDGTGACWGSLSGQPDMPPDFRAGPAKSTTPCDPRRANCPVEPAAP